MDQNTSTAVSYMNEEPIASYDSRSRTVDGKKMNRAQFRRWYREYKKSLAKHNRALFEKRGAFSR